jgi:hypothetical protein
LWIGRDDFEIAARPERQQSVLCSSAWMDTAKRGANSATLLDEPDAAVKIVATKKNVIEESGHLIRSPGKFGHGKRGGCDREKRSAGIHPRTSLQ